MLVLLWGLLYALLALLIAALIILSTPLRVALQSSKSPRWRLAVAVRLLGGFAPRMTVYDSARPAKKARKSAKRRDRAAARSPRPKKQASVRAIAAAPKLFSDIVGVFRLTRLRIDADIGLGDPAAAGELYGWIATAQYSLPQSPDFKADLRPDFSCARFEGEAEAEISFIPIAFVPPAIRFAWRAFGPRP